jgi:cytochrome c oxidase assembly protein subunit 15
MLEAMRRLAPRTYAALTAAVAWAVAVIIVTGGAVRLTGSGLGCPDWPTCTQDRLVAEWDYHQMVEFVNRSVTGLVSIAVILAVLGALFRSPRRRDLVVLALLLVAGVVGQIVLGGITVLFDLAPQLVAGHFLLSLVLLATAVVLHDRATSEPGPAVAAAPAELIRLSRFMLVAVTTVVITGTVVTGSGPHGGDTRAQRFPFLPTDVARVHSLSVWVFLALALVAVTWLRRAGAAESATRRGNVLLVAIVAQGAIGYIQYFTGVPALLVGIHLAGAATVFAATLRFYLGLFRRPRATETMTAWPEPRLSKSNVPTSVGTPATTNGQTGPGS